MPATEPDETNAVDAVARSVRRLDYDRYLTLVFAPADVRGALTTLYAFNIEIAKTRETVTEPLLGQIRLQWWRESIDGTYAGTPRRHEIVKPLAEAIRRHDLTRAHFDTLIDAREFDLGSAPPATLDQLESYAADTSSRLLQLALEICGIRGAAADRAAQHIGVAWALTGLLRAVRFHAIAKRQFLPADVMAEAGVPSESLFELRPTPALCAAVQKIAARAKQHLQQGMVAAGELSARLPSPLLLAPLTRLYLRRLERAGYDVWTRPIQVGPLRKQWALLAGRRGPRG